MILKTLLNLVYIPETRAILPVASHYRKYFHFLFQISNYPDGKIIFGRTDYVNELRAVSYEIHYCSTIILPVILSWPPPQKMLQ